MEYIYLDGEVLETSDLSCLVPAVDHVDSAILDLSDTLALSPMPKSNFLDKVKTLISKKSVYKLSKKTLLQQIQSVHFHDEALISSSAYRKTTKIWAFKIIPFKDPYKR